MAFRIWHSSWIYNKTKYLRIHIKTKLESEDVKMSGHPLQGDCRHLKDVGNTHANQRNFSKQVRNRFRAVGS